jgi:shikimate kinase
MNMQANSGGAPEPDVSGEAESSVPGESCAPCSLGLPACLADGRPVFLVGMMGAGKTTIGRGLAKVLGREFLDLDHELEARCGVRVPVIFEIEGEAGFRRREAQALQECTQRRNIVLATGGGAILAEESRRTLHERGLVVYLRATLEELFRRTSRDRGRPLLANPDPKGTLRQMMTMREPLYSEVAHVAIDTGAPSVNAVIKQVLSKLHNIETAQ